MAQLREQQLIPNSDVSMVDIGANIGMINIGLLLAGAIDRAIAIEPEPFNYELLCLNIEQNNLSDRVVPIPYAVGAKSQLVAMRVSSNNLGDHRVVSDALPTADRVVVSREETISVQSYSLNELLVMQQVAQHLNGKPSLVWIDVQGYEGYVFIGGSILFSEGTPTVSEVWPEGIRGAGMTLEEFADIVIRYWNYYYLSLDGTFVRFSTQDLLALLKELEEAKSFTNAIFVRM